MSQRITIDLVKNPQVADLVSDKEPGAAITLHTTIVSRDDQTLILELEETEEGTKSEEAAKEPAPDSPSDADSAAMAVATGKAK